MKVSPGIAPSRAHMWLEGLGEWSWPGARPQPDPMPPSWVPAIPPPIALAVPAGSAGHPVRSAPRDVSWRALALALLALLCTAVAAGAVMQERRALERLTGIAPSTPARTLAADTRSPVHAAAQLPSLAFLDVAPSGSTINAARYNSAALHDRGSFLVYLPPDFTFGAQRYPVLYLLHGNGQRATAFLELGVRRTLDRLISEGAIPPLIAIMVEGGSGANNWRDEGARGYESYVLEVQQLVDRLLPTIAQRGARAIAGDSMGGYGAMNIALGHPDRFAVVESWLGFFNGLGGELRSAHAVIARSGLSAFVYGGSSDTIADPSENAPFAAALRSAGASATGVVYAGGHTIDTLAEHLTHMLTFAGRALAPSVPGWPRSQ